MATCVSCIVVGVLAMGTAICAAQPDGPTRGTIGKPNVKVTISRETTYITSPLRPDGYPDYPAALEQRLKNEVTPQNNGAALCWEAFGPGPLDQKHRQAFFKKLGIPIPAQGPFLTALETCAAVNEGADPDASDLRSLKEPLSKQQSAAMQRPWSREEFPHLVVWLKTNKKPLRLIAEGTRRPKYYTPLMPGEHPTLSMVRLHGLQSSREAARALVCRAMLRLKEGKIDACWDDLLTCHRLGRMVGQGPALLDVLAGINIEGFAHQGHTALIQSTQLSSGQARKFAADLRQLPPPLKVAGAVELTERFLYLESVCSLARCGVDSILAMLAEGRIPGEIGAATRLAGDLLIDWDFLLRDGNQWFDRFAATAKLPSHAQRAEAMKRLTQDANRIVAEAKDLKGHALSLLAGTSPRALASRLLGNLFAAMHVPAISASLVCEERAGAQLKLVEVAILLAAYRADRGGYPQSLMTLVPGYLAEVPRDPFAADGDLRYRRLGGGYVLYSVGVNGKDDHGRTHSDREGKEASQDWDDLAIRVPGR